ncbi:PEGA domain-containing protein [Vibrio cholerae]|uniref:PEGA domain-containing protein n=1 Tax=Vibrio cholerae TaxID=666 RepID=UPI000300C31D|nr:PEGA domain-containing protein [Vibrio cholerae]ELJ8516744.1 PEGA domain-containing protein [Vibrio cholerae]MCD6678905.1 PEGA domain-containing protein [Vibrio cholerae]PNM40399.1 PEGA domain-containing protein [Vibrio cholerae]TQP43928.1 PEGA domain-containing protein [Vibrio cholerae]TQP68047.1 PEGA domain-containing protein [Vibrio cholerae]
MKKLLIGFILLVSLSGCAAMFHGTSQQVSIRSKNPAAKIYVNDAYLGEGNVITTFKKNQNYTIRVEEDDCHSVTIPVTKSFDAITLLGVFIDFGIVSILVVDGVGTGAWQQFDQTNYIVNANCSK